PLISHLDGIRLALLNRAVHISLATRVHAVNGGVSSSLQNVHLQLEVAEVRQSGKGRVESKTGSKLIYRSGFEVVDLRMGRAQQTETSQTQTLTLVFIISRS